MGSGESALPTLCDCQTRFSTC